MRILPTEAQPLPSKQLYRYPSDLSSVSLDFQLKLDLLSIIVCIIDTGKLNIVFRFQYLVYLLAQEQIKLSEIWK